MKKLMLMVVGLMLIGVGVTYAQEDMAQDQIRPPKPLQEMIDGVVGEFLKQEGGNKVTSFNCLGLLVNLNQAIGKHKQETLAWERRMQDESKTTVTKP